MSTPNRRRLALADNPLEDMVGGAADIDEMKPRPDADSPPLPKEEALSVTTERTEDPAPSTKLSSQPKPRATKPSSPSSQPKTPSAPKREPAPGVSASSAYRIGTVLDPYHRSDGEVVRPMRLTLPVKLIENIQVLAARRGRTPRSLVQQLLQEFVSDNQSEL